MLKKIQLLFLFLLPNMLFAQTIDMDRLVTLRYRNQQLGFILSDISRKYGIPFSYSSNFIPVAKRISISERKVSLETGLKKLFAPTKIIYAIIGNSIALKIDESKEVIPIIEVSNDRQRNIESEELTLLNRRDYILLKWEHRISDSVLQEMKTVVLVKDRNISDKKETSEAFLYKETTQVTLIPPISTHKEEAEKYTNTFSFNVLWGRNGGLEGIEVGGFVNNIVNDMHGFQLAGLGNIVEGDVQGGQLGFGFNYNKGFTKGVQASLLNIVSTANVIQLAGFANIVQEDFEGVQIALGGNYVRTKANGTQVAGLFNHSDGYAEMQLSLGLNKAEEIKKVQVGLINVANYVKGRQVGIINIAEHTEKTPIGLISIIKNGYNKIELSTGDALYVNAGFKFGFRKFYNILQFGTQFTNDIWSLGYGLGTAFKLKNTQHFHIEYIASHVNENEVWTKDLNLLSQFKFNFDWQTKGKSSFFLGPTWNIMASKLKNPEMMEVIGSNLPNYTLINTTRNTTNWKMWFGINGGIRF